MNVSVIIPVYNAEDYIERCLISVVNQSLRNIEIICVDDFSTDNSLKILEDYQERYPQIKIIKHNENKGESCARNSGINASSGEFIAFLDNDDEWDLDFLEKLYQKAKLEDSDIAVGNVEEFDYQGKKVLIKELNKNVEKNKMYFVSHWWRAIYKSKMIKDNNIFLPDGIPLGGDLLFLNKAILAANKISVVNDVYYHYYRRENSGDSKVWNTTKLNSALKIYNMIIDSLNLSKIYEYNLDGYIYAYFTYATGPIYAAMHISELSDKVLCVKNMFKMYEKCVNKDSFDNMLKEFYPVTLRYFHSNDIDGCAELLLQNKTMNKFLCTNRVHLLRQNVLTAGK